MNRCQFSIIFLFLSIFAASNGKLTFIFQHEDLHRPPCIDDMKIVYLVNRTNLPFHKRFAAIHTIGATQIEECSVPKVKFISSTAIPTPNEKKFFEDHGADPLVVAVVLRHPLRSYSSIHAAHAPESQHRWTIEIEPSEFRPIYDIERLREPEWIVPPVPLPPGQTSPPPHRPTTAPTNPPPVNSSPPPPPQNPSSSSSSAPTTTSPKDSPESMSTSPSSLKESSPTKSPDELPTPAAQKEDKEECEGFPLWGYIVIAVLAVLFFVSFVSAIWCCCKNRELRRQLKSMNKTKKLNPESEKTATTTQMQQSAESKSKSVVQKKNRSKRSKGNKTSGTKESE